MLSLIEFQECLLYPCESLQGSIKLDMNDGEPKRNTWLINESNVSVIKKFYSDMLCNVTFHETELSNTNTVVNNVALKKLYKVVKND